MSLSVLPVDVLDVVITLLNEKLSKNLHAKGDLPTREMADDLASEYEAVGWHTQVTESDEGVIFTLEVHLFPFEAE